MSTKQITVKPNKHRIHPCPNDKKLSLLNLLITQNNKMKILVVTANSLELIKEAITDENILIMDDKELSKSTELTCELLISYDLPLTADLYVSRVAKSTDTALILLDSSEQKQLYPIETLLGRAIKQDKIDGFEYEDTNKMKIAQKTAQKPKKEYEFKKTYEDKPKFDDSKKDSFKSAKNSFDKPRRDSDSNDKSKNWEKKEKKQNKFLGKDENGKAIFSGKSGDRNHRYDGTPKDKYSAPKKVGRKIEIKARKPKETPES